VTEWALILGASSGFGAATARALAGAGMNIIGVHLDRRNTLPNAEAVIADVKKAGREALFFNKDAEGDESRAEVLAGIEARFKEGGPHTIRVLLHSLAFGTLKPYVGEDRLNRKNFEMTLNVMANSLVYWTSDVVAKGLMGKGGCIYAMTSAGGRRVWPAYGAVSAAKAALESHIRQLALELAPKGITANSIQAGVTDTPALRKIPGHEAMIERTKAINPFGRLTTPEDVGNAIVHLSHPSLGFMTGNCIRIDGGEDMVG
jgi:enoyl-[acyl-carrier protein] reductase III